MALTAAEVRCDAQCKGKRDEYAEGLDQAGEALELLRRAGDQQLQAAALLVSAFLHLRSLAPAEAASAAEASLALVRGLGGGAAASRGEARATHALAAAAILSGKLDMGLKLASDAVALFKAAGDRRLEASENLALARWALLAGEPKRALAAAQEARKAFEVLSCRGGWAGASVHTCAEAMVARGRAREALRLCKDASLKFMRADDWKDCVFVQDALARVHLAMGAHEKAHGAVASARSLLQARSEESWEARLCHTAAAAHLAGKDFKQAIAALQAAAALAATAEDDDEAAAAQRALSYVHSTMPHGNYKDALKAASAAKHLSRQAGDRLGEACDMMDIAVAHTMMEDTASALASAGEARARFRELQDARGESGALQLMAEVRAADRQFEAALEVADERLTIALERSAPDLEARARHQVAAFHLADQSLAEAEKVARQAAACALKAGDAQEEARIQMTLMEICMEAAGDSAADRGFAQGAGAAMKAAMDAVAAAGRSGDRALQATACLAKATVMLWHGSHQEADRAVGTARSLFLSLGSEAGEARCLVVSAQLKLARGGADAALDALAKAAALAKKAGDALTEFEAATIFNSLKAQLHAGAPDKPGGGDAVAAGQADGPAVAGEASPDEEEDWWAWDEEGMGSELRSTLAAMVKEVMATEEDLELDSPFMDAGMDSLSSVSLMQALTQELGLSASPSLVFDYPTLRALEAHLLEEYKNMGS
ncbi:unnamed protein product [Prorocentrum cordatum]|uniref:Carrier domain-containing protein n=1 Tax=Prorocentrum cordatum TaxID=2364126 RepID=A0ABN9UW26_9DINO|nr:unnamed protein product [Polarella glacialis]